MCGEVILLDGTTIMTPQDMADAGMPLTDHELDEVRVELGELDVDLSSICMCCFDPWPALRRSRRPWRWDPIFDIWFELVES